MPRAELQAIEEAQQVRLGEGDILLFRTGHHRRRLALGAWSNDYPAAGQGKAGLHVDTVAAACAEEGRFEFMVVGLPLRLPGATGSPWNPIAIF